MQIDLSSILLFSDFSNEQMDKLSNIISVKEYEENEYVFVEGSKSSVFYIIYEGKVKILKSSVNGKEKILGILTEGDFLGEMGVIENKPRSASGMALSPLKLLLIEGEDFSRLVRENPEITLKIIVELSKRLRRANRDIELLAFFDVETRLKELFKRMAVKVVEFNDIENKVMVLEKITHKEIADHIGTSRETVTRLVNRLVDRGLIEINQDNIILKNLEKW